MKNILILIILFSFISVDAQKQTKKYNSLQDRYEYYNARGQMTGYEVYNSLQEQWEYYSVKTSSSSNRYGEPVSTFDADLAFKVLQAKQQQYDNQKQKKIEEFEYITRRFDKAFSVNNEKLEELSSKEWEEASQLINNWWEDYLKRNNKNFNYANVERIVSHIARSYDESIKKVKSKRYVPKYKYGDYVETYSYSI